MILGERRWAVLKVIVEEYISGAAPIASKTIADRGGLNVSTATIRNDTAYLEQEGFVTHPHHSAGSVPTDRAYRCYLESISQDALGPSMEQHFEQMVGRTTDELERWLRLGATLLARLVRNMVVITSPKASSCRLKYMDLVSLHEFMALLILVLYEARVRRHVLSFDRRVGQDELTMWANRLNAAYAGRTTGEIRAEREGLSAEEKQVAGHVADLIAAEDETEYGEPWFEGLRLMLGQPEFAGSYAALDVLEALEGESWLRVICPRELDKGEVKAIIGEENPDPALQSLSLIFSQYGVPERASGIVGVIGPRRMDYARVIPALNSLSMLLSDSVAEYI